MVKCRILALPLATNLRIRLVLATVHLETLRKLLRGCQRLKRLRYTRHIADISKAVRPEWFDLDSLRDALLGVKYTLVELAIRGHILATDWRSGSVILG